MQNVIELLYIEDVGHWTTCQLELDDAALTQRILTAQ